MANLLLGELERALAHEVLEVGRVALHHEQHVVHDVRAEAALQRPQLHAHQLQVRSLLRVCTPRAALVLYLLMYWPSYLSTRPQTSRCALLFINVRIFLRNWCVCRSSHIVCIVKYADRCQIVRLINRPRKMFTYNHSQLDNYDDYTQYLHCKWCMRFLKKLSNTEKATLWFSEPLTD